MEQVELDTTAFDALDERLQGTNLDRSVVVDYLMSSPLVLSARMKVPDRFDQSAPAIPVAFLSDGGYVWSVEVATYVQRYGFAVSENFVRHLLAVNGVWPESLDETVRHEVVEWIKNRSREGNS